MKLITPIKMINCPPPPGFFSDGALIEFRGLDVIDRSDLIKQLLSGMRVLHFGCCDHLPQIEEKMRKNDWFHDLVVKAAEQVVGIDVVSEALMLCSKLRPSLQFVEWNIINDDVPGVIKSSHWDYCLVPEVIEHLDNPVLFLTVLHEHLVNKCDRLFCTVPNAFLLGNFYSATRHREIINTDHRHWYTPATILKILSLAGFSNFELCMLRYGRKRGLKGVIKRSVETLWPMFASSIGVVATFTP